MVEERGRVRIKAENGSRTVFIIGSESLMCLAPAGPGLQYNISHPVINSPLCPLELCQRHVHHLLLGHLSDFPHNSLAVSLPEAVIFRLALATLSLGPEPCRDALYLDGLPTHDKHELLRFLDHMTIRCPNSAA